MISEDNIEEYLPLVRRVARKFNAKFRATNFDDLVGDGSVGLLLAIRRFNPELGYQFEAYATKYIKGYMYQGIINWSMVGRYGRDHGYRITMHGLSDYVSEKEKLTYAEILCETRETAPDRQVLIREVMEHVDTLSPEYRVAVSDMLKEISPEVSARRDGMKRGTVSQRRSRAIKVLGSGLASLSSLRPHLPA